MNTKETNNDIGEHLLIIEDSLSYHCKNMGCCFQVTQDKAIDRVAQHLRLQSIKLR